MDPERSLAGTGRPVPDARRARRRARRRWALLALALSPVLAWVSRGTVLHPLLARTAEGLAPSFGWRLEVGTLEGDWFHRLGVRGLELRANDEGSRLRTLLAEELSCELDAWEVVRSGIGGLRAIAAAGVEVDLDLRGASSAPDSTGGFELLLPDHLPRVDVSRASVRARLPNEEELVLEGIELALRPREAGLEREGASDSVREGANLLVRAGASHSDRDGASLVVTHIALPPSLGLPPAHLEATFAREPAAGVPSIVIERLSLVAGDDRLEVDGLGVPLAWERPEDLLRELRGRVVLDAPDPLRLALRGPQDELWLGPLHVELRAGSGVLSVEQGELGFPGGSLANLRGSLAAFPAAEIDVAADARVEDLAPLGAMLGLAPWSGTLEGRARLAGDLRAPVLAAELAGRECIVAGRPLGDVVLVAHTDFRSLGVDSFHASSPAGEIDLGGSIDFVARKITGATLQAELARPELLQEGFPAGTLVLEAELAGPFGALTGRVHAQSPLLERPDMRFEDVVVDARWIDGRIEIEELAAGTTHGTLSARGSLDRQTLRVEHLRLRDGEEQLLELAATLPVDAEGLTIARSGELSIGGELRLPAGLLPSWSSDTIEIAFDQAVQATVEITGSADAPRGRITLDAAGLRIASRRDGAGPPWCGALVASVRIDEAIVLEDSHLSGDQLGTVRASGRSMLDPDLHELVATRGGALLDAPFDVAARGELDEIGWVADLYPSIRRVAGSVEATVEVSGTPRQPMVRGSLRVTGGELRVASAFPPLESVTADIVLEDSRIEIRELLAEIGAAPLAVQGSIELGSPGEPAALDLEIDGTNVLLARSSELRLRADADLHVTGTLAAPLVAGKLDLRNTRLRHDVDFLGMLQPSGARAPSEGGFTLFSLRSPPLSDMQLDVEIGALEPIELESNVADARIRPVLRIGGTGAIPTAEGRIFLDDLELDLPGGHFRFPGGTIIFDRADPFHPRLELTGKARLAGHDVTMEISGTIDEPVVDLESSPPLARERLFMLVVSGTLPPEDMRDSGELAARSITLYVAKDVVSSWFSDPDDDGESLFDGLEIVTGSEVSKGGVLSTEASLRVREDVLRENDALYLVAERDVYEDYNMGLRIVFRFP